MPQPGVLFLAQCRPAYKLLCFHSVVVEHIYIRPYPGKMRFREYFTLMSSYGGNILRRTRRRQYHDLLGLDLGNGDLLFRQRLPAWNKFVYPDIINVKCVWIWFGQPDSRPAPSPFLIQREQLKHGVVDVYISFSGFDPIHIKLHLVRSFSLSSAFNPVKAVNMEFLVKIHLPVGIWKAPAIRGIRVIPCMEVDRDLVRIIA